MQKVRHRKPKPSTGQSDVGTSADDDKARVSVVKSGSGGSSMLRLFITAVVGMLTGALVWLLLLSSGEVQQDLGVSDAPGFQERNDILQRALSDAWMCTPKQAPPRVVWNRIYKTGALAMESAISAVAEGNNYTFAMSKNYDFFATHNSEELRMEVAVGVVTADFPGGELGGRPVVQAGAGLAEHDKLLYSQVMTFMDFTQWGLQQPEYVNLLRHPIERYAQNFIQMQAYQSRRPEKFPCTWNVTLDQCLSQRRTRSCMGQCGTRNLMTWALCGSSEACQDPASPEALAVALHNLQYKYAAVGLLEYLPTSLQLFETILPRYFSGLAQRVEQSGAVDKPKTMPSQRSATPFLDASPLSEENRVFVAEQNANDVRLYRAARRLLRQRAKACGIPMVITGSQEFTGEAAEEVEQGQAEQGEA